MAKKHDGMDYGRDRWDYTDEEVESVFQGLVAYYVRYNGAPTRLDDFVIFVHARRHVSLTLDKRDIWRVMQRLRDRWHLVTWDHGNNPFRLPTWRLTQAGQDRGGITIDAPPKPPRWVRKNAPQERTRESIDQELFDLAGDIMTHDLDPRIDHVFTLGTVSLVARSDDGEPRWNVFRGDVLMMASRILFAALERFTKLAEDEGIVRPLEGLHRILLAVSEAASPGPVTASHRVRYGSRLLGFRDGSRVEIAHGLGGVVRVRSVDRPGTTLWTYLTDEQIAELFVMIRIE